MKRTELFTLLNKLCKELDNKYCINSGGCCFVAACLAEQLEKSKISFKVYCCYDPTHYWIKVSDRNINRDFFHAEETRDWTSDELFELYYETIWNDWYSKRWNLIVRTKIASLFKKYENSRS